MWRNPLTLGNANLPIGGVDGANQEIGVPRISCPESVAAGFNPSEMQALTAQTASTRLKRRRKSAMWAARSEHQVQQRHRFPKKTAR